MKQVLAVAVAAAIATAFATTALGSNEPLHRGGDVAVAGKSATRAAAARATGSYEGEFKPANQQGSEIVISAAIRNGKATKVKRMRYLALMDCETSGATVGEAGWLFGRRGIKVKPNRRFSLASRGRTEPVSTFTFKGRFSRNFKRVRGTFKTHQWFEEQTEPTPLPAEYCDMPTTRYAASR